jgi:hypothetical protein
MKPRCVVLCLSLLLSGGFASVVHAGKPKQTQPKNEATESTGERNSAYVALRAYMKELKGVACVALRGKPGLLAKLEL